MKRILIFISFLLTTNLLFCQSQGTLFGGISISTAGHSEMKTNFVSGAHIGIEFFYELDADFFLKALPQFNQGGYGYSMDTLSGKIKTSTFKFPIKIQQKGNLNSIKYYYEAGPYFALGIGGKNKIDGHKEEEVYFGKDNALFDPFDYGLGVGGGIEFNNFKLGMGVDFGVKDISTKSNATIYNRMTYISVGLIW